MNVHLQNNTSFSCAQRADGGGGKNDHHGNTRAVYRIPECGSGGPKYEYEALIDYYPFGKELRSSVPLHEKYYTTHHERDLKTQLDYRGARFYDPEVGRFWGVDGMASARNWASPYNYVQNNPVLRIDPDGNFDGDYFDLGGNYLGTDEVVDGLEHTIKREDFFEKPEILTAEGYKKALGDHVISTYDRSARAEVKKQVSDLSASRGPILVREVTLSFVAVTGGNLTLGRVEDGVDSRWYFRPSAAIGFDAGIAFTYEFLDPKESDFNINTDFEGKDFSYSGGSTVLFSSGGDLGGDFLRIKGDKYTTYGFAVSGGGFKLGYGGQYNWGVSRFID